jgi:hypothetical protein
VKRWVKKVQHLELSFVMSRGGNLIRDYIASGRNFHISVGRTALRITFNICVGRSRRMRWARRVARLGKEKCI